MSAPFDFRRRSPPPGLERLVEATWYARGRVPYAQEKVAPTGACVAIIVLGDPILQTAAGQEPLSVAEGALIGPHDRPMINAPTGETYALGVVTTPIGCEALFGVTPKSIKGRVTPLLGAWEPAWELRQKLCLISNPERQLDALNDALIQHRNTAPAGLGRAARAVAMLEADPTQSIAEIAAELDISHGHLDREFVRIVGLSPRALARLLRVRRLLEGLDVRGPVDWTTLAAELGWYDQAHLIRDFKRHTGVTPSDYLAAQRAGFTDVDPEHAAGFVPEPHPSSSDDPT